MPVESIWLCSFEAADGWPCQLEAGHDGDHDSHVRSSWNIHVDGELGMSGELDLQVIRGQTEEEP